MGFDRILINHLDGRGVRVASPQGKVITSGMTIILRNEGMPSYKNPDVRGSLYIVMDVEMPSEDWMSSVDHKVVFFSPGALHFILYLMPRPRHLPRYCRQRKPISTHCQRL
jgi:DnaJ-class molecular chaperone